MAIRIQPREIEVPPGNPFAHDLLERQEQVQVLTMMVANLDGPCAMALDAAWGAGKTTFLRMWAQYLRDGGYPVVQFNAWETDFTEEPFIALASEISQGLQDWQESGVRPAVESMTAAARSIARWVLPGAVRLAASLIPVAGGEVGQAASALAAQLFDEYPQARQSVSDFRLELQKMADTLWETSDQRPLVVLIDELDRCRPSYAIELLETCKHIFSMDHVVFVLAVNRSELAHSVRALYGPQFDAQGYLGRFFDHDIFLPSPDRQKFIQDMLTSLGIIDALERSERKWRVEFAIGSARLLTEFLGHSNLSLREVGQAIHRFAVVLSSLSDAELANTRLLTILTILKAVDPPLYRGFANGVLNDQQITSGFLGRPEYADLLDHSVSELLEAVVMEARSDGNAVYQPTADLETRAPLLWSYHVAVREANRSGLRDSHNGRNRRILSMVQDLFGFRSEDAESRGLQESVRRIELLSRDLMGSARPQ